MEKSILKKLNLTINNLTLQFHIHHHREKGLQ